MASHYRRVPKGLDANLRFRKELLAAGGQPAAAAAIMDACSEDLLFWVNAFAWLYEPRGKPGLMVLPFVTYNYQDEALLALNGAVEGQYDLVMEKSRDVGATWCCLAALVWRWLYRPMESFLIGSRTAEYVDKPNNSKSLFWKLDLIVKNLPEWMKPELTRVMMEYLNVGTGSTISGESANPNFGQGDRRTAVFLDEFALCENGYSVLAATADVSGCRIFNSTPCTKTDAFYYMVERTQHKLRMHWSAHPVKSKGLYRDKDARPRSPWYDKECTRRTPAEVAQQLDIDYAGSSYLFFKPEEIEVLVRRDARPAYARLPAAGFMADVARTFDKGHLDLWINLDVQGRPDRDAKFVVGADVSGGTGASNSTLAVANVTTGERVGEYVNPNIRPEEFGILAEGVCKFFNNARLIWESNGAGRHFGAKVLDRGYRNLYYRRDDDTLIGKMSDIPGWHSSAEGKRKLLGEYREALGVRYINRSEQALRECLEYIYVPSRDSIEHSKSLKTDDPSGARSNHGDRVIADALCVKEIKETVGFKPKVLTNEPPVGCLAHRRWLEVQTAKERYED